VAKPPRDHYRDNDAVEDGRRAAEHCILRSGKAENAVRAAGKIGLIGRQVRCAGRIMQAELERRRVLARVCRQSKAGERDQEALDRDRIGDDDAQQRPPKTRPYAV
jgi:hypothetical protein